MVLPPSCYSRLWTRCLHHLHHLHHQPCPRSRPPVPSALPLLYPYRLSTPSQTPVRLPSWASRPALPHRRCGSCLWASLLWAKHGSEGQASERGRVRRSRVGVTFERGPAERTRTWRSRGGPGSASLGPRACHRWAPAGHGWACRPWAGRSWRSWAGRSWAGRCVRVSSLCLASVGRCLWASHDRTRWLACVGVASVGLVSVGLVSMGRLPVCQASMGRPSVGGLCVGQSIVLGVACARGRLCPGSLVP
jgi:hypothetical protein